MEVPLDGEFPDTIPMQFCEGVVYHQIVAYEWKPVRCSNYGWLGHDATNCRRNKGNIAMDKPKQVEAGSNAEEGISKTDGVTVVDVLQENPKNVSNGEVRAEVIGQGSIVVEKQNGRGPQAVG